MEKTIKVTVDGREYPCYPTMGACVRFHDMTGKEVAEVKGWQTSLQCVYLYCCVKSACEREKVDFPYECAEFCDNVPLGDLHAWLEAEWERMRLHAVMTMQPHCGKKLNPRKVLPFAWEKTRRPGHVDSAPELSKAEAKEAFLKRIGKSEE